MLSKLDTYLKQNGAIADLTPGEVIRLVYRSMAKKYHQIILELEELTGNKMNSILVVIFDDELKEVAKEIICNHTENKVMIGLDCFDASINRIAAWATGERSVEKALLYAALLPNEELAKEEEEANFTKPMVMQEKAKLLPFGAIWEEYLARQNLTDDYYDEVMNYEKEVLAKRG